VKVHKQCVSWQGDLIMATTITEPPIEADRERSIAEARADLLRRAEAQGIKPITSIEDLAGNPEMTADFDVDEFLRQIREERDRPSTRSLE
jgi:hypothetical protein